MIITDFGHFTVVNPDAHILYYKQDDGLDWYEMRAALTSWEIVSGDFIDSVYGTWVTVDADGTIIHVEYNPCRLVPDDKTILGIDTEWTSVKPGMIWDGTEIWPATPETLEKVGPPWRR